MGLTLSTRALLAERPPDHLGDAQSARAHACC